MKVKHLGAVAGLAVFVFISCQFMAIVGPGHNGMVIKKSKSTFSQAPYSDRKIVTSTVNMPVLKSDFPSATQEDDVGSSSSLDDGRSWNGDGARKFVSSEIRDTDGGSPSQSTDSSGQGPSGGMDDSTIMNDDLHRSSHSRSSVVGGDNSLQQKQASDAALFLISNGLLRGGNGSITSRSGGESGPGQKADGSKDDLPADGGSLGEDEKNDGDSVRDRDNLLEETILEPISDEDSKGERIGDQLRDGLRLVETDSSAEKRKSEGVVCDASYGQVESEISARTDDCVFRTTLPALTKANDQDLLLVHMRMPTPQKVHVLVSRTGNDMVDVNVRRCRRWDPHITSIVQEIARDQCQNDPSSLVVDVGANLGTVSLLAAGMGCSVYAFEPQAEMVTRLLLVRQFENIPDSRLSVYRTAISNEAGETFITLAEDENDEPVGYHVEGECEGRRCQAVSSVRLDDVVKEDVMILKIDVEGYEQKVLEGASLLLTKYSVDNVLVEFSPSLLRERGRVDPVTILESMDDRGYDVHAVAYAEECDVQVDPSAIVMITPPIPRSLFKSMVQDITDKRESCILWRMDGPAQVDLWFRKKSKREGPELEDRSEFADRRSTEGIGSDVWDNCTTLRSMMNVLSGNVRQLQIHTKGRPRIDPSAGVHDLDRRGSSKRTPTAAPVSLPFVIPMEVSKH